MFVKICGTTTEEDALLAVALGADALGFIFAPSTRQVAPQHVHDIVRRLPPDVLTVGVFRDESPQRVVEIVNTVGLRGAQLSGRETAEQTQWVRQRVPVVLKGFPAGDPAAARAGEFGADIVLVDSATPGSGKVFDWRLADDVPSGLRLVLAGGLHPGNVAEAIGSVRPWGVDVATGVEASPGRKDPRKLRAFVASAKAAGEALREGDDGADHDADGPYDWQDDDPFG